jgi:hypothetical protein
MLAAAAYTNAVRFFTAITLQPPYLKLETTAIVATQQ